MTPRLAAPEAPETQPPDDALQAEQIRLLFRFSVVGHLATLLVIFILGAILWEDLGRPALFIWFVSTAMVAFNSRKLVSDTSFLHPALVNTRRACCARAAGSAQGSA